LSPSPSLSRRLNALAAQFAGERQRSLDEYHRYFPEWADRRSRGGVAREAEHNSYLAGGYAEEFGYHSRAGGPFALPPLMATNPEHCVYWRAQIGGLHPGYPELPTPLARFWRDPQPPQQLHIAPQPATVANARSEFAIVRVGSRDRNTLIGMRGLRQRWRELRIRRRELGVLF